MRYQDAIQQIDSFRKSQDIGAFSDAFNSIQLYNAAQNAGLNKISYADALKKFNFGKELRDFQNLSRSKQGNWLNYVNTSDIAQQYLQSLGNFDANKYTVLGQASAKGYTGNDVFGAYGHIGTYDEIFNRAKAAGLNPTEGMTLEQLNQLTTATPQVQQKFNDTQNPMQQPASTQTPTGTSGPASGSTAQDYYNSQEYQDFKNSQQQQVAGASTGPQFTGSLSAGSRGDSVIQLQKALGITSDGVFGPKTQAAVKAYQQSKGLVADGIVGPKTFAALYGTSGNAGGSTEVKTVASGSSGNSGASGTGSGQQGTQTLFGNDVSNILKNEFGIDLANKSPMTGFADIYQQVLTDSGALDIKKDRERLNDEYGKLQTKKNGEIMQINNDPWLTEGERVRRLQKLDDKYKLEENTLTNKMQLLESLYESARNDAQFIAGKIYDQAKGQQDLMQDFILKAVDIAEKRAEAAAKLQSPSDIYGTGIIGEYNFAKAQGYNGSFIQYQNEDANRKQKASGGGSGGLGGMFSAAQINSTINSIVSSYDNEPIIKNFNQIKSANDFVQSLSGATTNPSDDQALVYAFAKAMDPDSVVREGEYATAQRYSQSWAKAYGKGIEQAIAGTGFLSEQARKNIKETIKSKYAVAEKSAKSLTDSYQKRLAQAQSGQGNTLQNYFSTPQTNTQSVSFNSPDWMSTYNYDADLKAAKDAIARGANKTQVKQIMLSKYKTVDL